MSAGVSGRVLKAMGIFGGVRMLQILFGVVRVKLVAIWLGPAGMGLFGIFNGAVDTVSTLTQLGIRSSAVRDIAGAPSEAGRNLMVAVTRRWGWMLGVLGAVVMAAFSPLLSRWTFGSADHSLSYVLLALSMFLLSVANAEEAIMQGLGALRRLAKASVWGVAAGFAVSVPMYYFWGIASVVPSIIAYSFSILAAMCFFRVPSGGGTAHITYGETFSRGKRFILLGIYMTLADFIAQALSYVFIVWLSRRAGEDEVGIYQAGYTMVNRYVGMIFAALASEYYPRLASVANSRMRLNVFVAHEIKVILMLLLPAVMLMISVAPWLVSLLYDSRFAPATSFITIAMAGVVLRGFSYCMSYLILARGDGRTFLVTESVSAVAGLALNLGCYHLWGIAGLGVSYTLWYLLYVLIIGWVYRFRYRLRLPWAIRRMVLAVLAVTLLSIVVGCIFAPLVLLPFALIVSAVSLQRLYKMFRGRRGTLKK
ncbi:MAG: oligosaccharide flippase family protein [Bacteroides sp.]|nr:oligosaccharide flippase family protein [Bacteroides sp.]